MFWSVICVMILVNFWLLTWKFYKKLWTRHQVVLYIKQSGRVAIKIDLFFQAWWKPLHQKATKSILLLKDEGSNYTVLESTSSRTLRYPIFYKMFLSRWHASSPCNAVCYFRDSWVSCDWGQVCFALSSMNADWCGRRDDRDLGLLGECQPQPAVQPVGLLRAVLEAEHQKQSPKFKKNA